MPDRGSCVACADALSFFGRRGGYEYARCRGCGTLQLNPLPRPEEVEIAYQASRYSRDNLHGQGDADAVRKVSRAHYECIRDTLKDFQVSGKILDYGAGWGGLVEFLREAGLEASGLELSKGMIAECQRRGLPVADGELSLLEPGSLSAVTMCGVFEHLAAPSVVLEEVHRVLGSGGTFVSLQPTAPFARSLATVLRAGIRSRELPPSFYVFDPPWHAALFSIGGMRKLAGRHGFKLLAVRPVPLGNLPGWAGLLQRVASPLNRAGWAVARTAWPLMVSHLFVFEK
jgi:SAM-dependent methyltransferase